MSWIRPAPGRAAIKIPPLFSRLRSGVVAEAAEDLEPEPRFSEAWNAWLLRDLCRGRCLAELAEAETLTAYAEDAAPIASEGFEPFMAWCQRQRERRKFRVGGSIPELSREQMKRHPLSGAACPPGVM